MRLMCTSIGDRKMLICCQRSDGKSRLVDAPATITRPSAGESTASGGAFTTRSGSRKKNRKKAESAARTTPSAVLTKNAATSARTTAPRMKGQPAGSMRIGVKKVQTSVGAKLRTARAPEKRNRVQFSARCLRKTKPGFWRTGGAGDL